MSETICNESSSYLLNVDLDLRSDHGLKDLLAAMEPDVFEMTFQEGARFLVVELANAQPRSVDKAISLYRDIVVKLDPETRALWDGCSSRIFNVGIQSVRQSRSVEFKISQASIALAQSINAGITVTVYAPVED